MPVSIHITSPDCSSSCDRVGIGKTGSPVTAVRPGRRPKRGITWNTGSTVFAVAPSSATARRNAPDNSVGSRAGHGERADDAHRRLVDRLRLADAFELVGSLRELGRPHARRRLRRDRGRAARATAGTTRRRSPTDRARVWSRARPRRRRSRPRARGAGIRRAIHRAHPRESPCRGAATARPARARRPRATTRRARDRPSACGYRSRTRRSVVRRARACRRPRLSIAALSLRDAVAPHAREIERADRIGHCRLRLPAFRRLQVHSHPRDEPGRDVEHDGLVGAQSRVAVVDGLVQLHGDAISVDDHVDDRRARSPTARR